MKRHVPGLNSTRQLEETPLVGAFLVRIAKVYYRWHPQKPFLLLQLSVLEPKTVQGRMLSGRLYCTSKALWKLNWFLRDFGYDQELLQQDQIDEKKLVNLRGIVRTTLVSHSGRSYQNLDAFAPAEQWDTHYCEALDNLTRSSSDDLQSHSNQ